MKSDNPKISVIVPVYNTEKYLKRCIDSILNQTFTDFEVLLINDGSTDSSGAICDEYAKQDSRVRVFHKDNGGVSSARNVGIRNMKGEYSIHCDSDDWIKNDMYEKLYNKALKNNLDIVICDFFVAFNDNKEKSIEKPTNLNSLSVCNDMLIGKLHGSTSNKLVRTSCILNHNILFDEQITYCEDVLFNTELLLSNPTIGYVAKPLYVYERISGSITNSILVKEDVLMFNDYCNTLYKLLKKNEKLRKVFHYHVLRVKLIILNSGFSDCKMIRKIVSSSNQYLFDSPLSLPNKVFLWLVFNDYCFLVKVLNKIKKYI